MLVSWCLVNSDNFDRRYLFKVLWKPANDWSICIHFYTSICLHLVKVWFSLHEFHSNACYSTIFNRIHFQSFRCRCTPRHLWLQQKDLARAHRKGHQKVKERAQQQSRQNQSCLGSDVYFSFFERDVEIVQHPLLRSIECLTWRVNLLCPWPCNDLVVTL